MADTIPKYGEFSEGRFWFSRKGNLVTLGLTDVAVDEAGVIEKISFPDEGGDYSKGEVVVTLEGTHGTVEIKTPAGGIIEGVNKDLNEDPSIVSDDPLEEGWLIKLECEDISELAEFAGDDLDEDFDDEDEDDLDDEEDDDEDEEDDEDDDQDDDDFEDEDEEEDDEDSDDEDEDEDLVEEDEDDDRPKKRR